MLLCSQLVHNFLLHVQCHKITSQARSQGGTTASLWMSLNSFMTWTNKGTANMLSSTHIQRDVAVVAVCVVFTLVYAK